MGADKDMTPVVFKNGRDFGKVIGIRGLYRSVKGVWYVRKAINGIDKQKKLDLGGKTPTFSTLEREAAKALKELTANIMPRVAQIAKESTRPKTLLERGQKACADYVTNIYAPQCSKEVGRRRIKEAEGFAFVTRGMKDEDAESLNKHNVLKLTQIINEKTAANQFVAAQDFWKHIQAIFSKAISYGAHKGLNPTAHVKKPADMSEKDTRFIGLEESAKVQANLQRYLNDHNIDERKGQEITLLHYLLTLGMRPSSAILFDSGSLKEEKGAYRYTVINHKSGRKMPVSQIVHPEFAKELKQIGKFSFCEKSLLDPLNQAIREILGKDVSAKHLRKGFLTEIIESGEFSESDARRLTHKSNDIVENHYYSLSQKAADAVSKWWNEKWYHHYTQCLKENEAKEAKENDGELMITLDEAEYDFLVRRSKFDRGLKDVIDDDEN